MANNEKSTQAFAYVRISSASIVGGDRDSEPLQITAIQTHAQRAGIEIEDTYRQECVSGADPVDSRPGFTHMLNRIEGNGVKTIIVETVSRFARDLMIQEVGFQLFTKRGSRS